MVANTLFRCMIGSVVVALALTAGAYAQQTQIYVGPGGVLSNQVYGPYTYGVNPYTVRRPYSYYYYYPYYYPAPLPQVYMPMPGSYLYGPLLLPPACVRPPRWYWPGPIGPYGPVAQPYPN